MTSVSLAEARRIAVGAAEAAAMLGVSRAFFLERITHELKCIRVGRRKLYRVVELERWAEANEARVLQ